MSPTTPSSPTEADPYRDALAAAQARIQQLERVVAERSAGDADAQTIAALLRERAATASATRPRNVWAMLRWIYVVFAVAAVAFAVEGDWVVAVLAVLCPIGMGFFGQRLLAGSAEAAARQIALIDERLAVMDQKMAARAAGPGSE